jgi:hypothetical protein
MPLPLQKALDLALTPSAGPNADRELALVLSQCPDMPSLNELFQAGLRHVFDANGSDQAEQAAYAIQRAGLRFGHTRAWRAILERLAIHQCDDTLLCDTTEPLPLALLSGYLRCANVHTCIEQVGAMFQSTEHDLVKLLDLTRSLETRPYDSLSRAVFCMGLGCDDFPMVSTALRSWRKRQLDTDNDDGWFDPLPVCMDHEDVPVHRQWPDTPQVAMLAGLVYNPFEDWLADSEAAPLERPPSFAELICAASGFLAILQSLREDPLQRALAESTRPAVLKLALTLQTHPRLGYWDLNETMDSIAQHGLRGYGLLCAESMCYSMS